MDLGLASSFLEAGDDVNAPDPDHGQVTPLHMAVDIECEDACRRYDAGDQTAAPIATFTRLLLDYGANPNLPNGDGKTPLDWALARNHVEAAQLFLTHAS